MLTDLDMHDGNVAFKLTWVYGERGPFTGPCTAEGRKINIGHDRKVWCSDRDSACFKIYDQAGNVGRIPADYIPCYEAHIYKSWSFGAGVYHNGPRRSQIVPMKRAQKGKWAFLTSKRSDMKEEDRVVIACFVIAKVDPDTDWGVVAKSVPSSRIRLNDLERAPRFWDYYKQNGPPRWGTGLFRYLSDPRAAKLHEAMKAASEKERGKIL